MAQLKYSELQSSQTPDNNNNAFNGKPRVGYFSLPNNGDTAIVRIMHDDPDTFDIVSVHSTYVDGKFRKINCLRGYGDPIENCPLCVKDAENNAYPSKRVYIHMIQYVKDENGNIVAQPVVWDRPAKRYCEKLINFMQEYGPLSNIIVKIKRNGAAGDTNTDYDIMMANQQLYPDNIYVNDKTLFDGYSVLGGAVLSKDYDALAYFAQYDSFPAEAEGGAPSAYNSANGWNSVPASVEDGIPFDSPEAQKMAEEIKQGFDTNGIPQWNPQPRQNPTPPPAQTYAPQQNSAPQRPVRQFN